MQPIPRFPPPFRHISGYLLIVGLTTMKMIGTENTFAKSHSNHLNNSAVNQPDPAPLNSKIGLQDQGLVQSENP